MARTPLQWQLEERVEDLFDLGSLVVAGRAGSLYKALEKGGTSAVWLLLGNSPFLNTAISLSGQEPSNLSGGNQQGQGSVTGIAQSTNQNVSGQSSERFVRRLQSLLVEPPLSNLLRYGVDANGMPFCAIPMLEGQELLGGLQFPVPGVALSPFVSGMVVAEGQRRFFQCLRLVEELHRRNFICGDLSEASFWLDGGGNVAFIGLLGDYNPAAAKISTQLLAYMAHEQESGGAADPTTDVYALAVLAYVLLTGLTPSGESLPMQGGQPLNPADIKPLSVIAPHVGRKFDGVLLKALSSSPQERYRNAGALFHALSTTSENDPINAIAVVDAAVVRGAKGQGGKSQDVANATRDFLATGIQEDGGGDLKSAGTTVDGRRIRFQTVVVLVLGIMALVLPIAFILSSDGNSTSGGHGLIGEGSALSAGSQLGSNLESQQVSKQGAAINLANARSFADQKKKMQEFALSDDPLAHESMVEAAISAMFEVDRKLPEEGILQRLKRLGQTHTERILSEWLNTRQYEDIKHAYAAVLRAANPSVPVEGRKQLFETAFSLSSRISIQLLAATMLDSPDPNAFSALFIKMGGASIKSTNGIPSALALIAQHPEVGPKFQIFIANKVNQFSDRDVLWLIDSLSGCGDGICEDLFRIADERKLVSPLRMEFLKALSDKHDLEPAIIDVIRHGIAGTVSTADVQILGSWLDKMSEKLLVLIAADSKDEDVVKAAFDIIYGKELSVEPSASFIKWMKKNPVKDRYRLSKAVAVMAFGDVVSQEELKKAVEGLAPYVSGSSLLASIIPVAPLRLTTMLISRYKIDMGLTELVPLLGHSDPQVRMQSVRALGNYNDAAALRVILDAFDRESDPEVRKVYKEVFWSARQRG